MKNALGRIAASLGLIVISCLWLCAQTMATRTLITCRQAGTLSIGPGKTTVDLSREVTDELSTKENSPSYYVIFTPVGTDARAVISDKGDRSFSVSCVAKHGAQATFDYMVFVKETVPAPDPRSVAHMKRAVPGSK